MTHDEAEEIAAVWLRYTEKREEDGWAGERLNTLVCREPEGAWPVLLRIIATAPDDVLGYLGAGELEDFVRLHAKEFGARIEDEARRDGRFREALVGAWFQRGELPVELEQRLQRLVNGRIRIL